MTNEGITSRDKLIGAALATLSLGWWGLLRLTERYGDAFDSPLWEWTWLALVAAVAGATYLRPRPLLWTLAAVAPMLAWMVLDHTLLAGPPQVGPDFWLLGVFFLIVEGLLALGAGALVVLLRRRVRA